MIMDACSESKYVLWMPVMNQVMCCKLVIHEKNVLWMYVIFQVIATMKPYGCETCESSICDSLLLWNHGIESQ